jgi:thymidylate synthase ThyX
MHSAKIIADSISQYGRRLTTMEVCFPRIVLAEFNTHRVFARNSASSRAIPVEKMLRAVEENPYVPSVWGRNQKGMQAGEEVDAATAEKSRITWLIARDNAVNGARQLLDLGIHKQTTNRLLEPFLWHTVIVTATEWSNFFHLRDHPAAHPDMQKVARLMREAYAGSKPALIGDWQWHLPYVTPEEKGEHSADLLRKVSTGRCARVSYLTHDGRRDIGEDVRLHDDLLKSGHMSPFEHVARPALPTETVRPSPFIGWVQYRKMIPGEADMLAPKVGP